MPLLPGARAAMQQGAGQGWLFQFRCEYSEIIVFLTITTIIVILSL